MGKGKRATAGAGQMRSGSLDRAKAWLVTGPLGRGLSFAIDFAVAVRRGLLRRSR